MKSAPANLLSERRLGDSWQGRRWHATSMRLICSVLVLIPSMAETLRAGDITWRNDSLVEGGDGYIQAGFRQGDIAAAVFDLPCGFLPLTIKSVQVFWQSQTSSAMQVATHLRMYGSGGPNPGSPIYTAEGTVMTAGFMNELSAAGLGWVIDQGPFAVGVEYLGQVGATLDDFSGHVTTDGDGCQPGNNLIYDAASGQWFDACGAGMSGDFVIRVVFESSGSGCFGDSNCDGDGDLLDYAQFQRCLSGDGNPADQQCLAFDCDADGDVDFHDFAALEACMSAPDVACNPVCATCQRAPDGGAPPGSPRWTLTQAAIVIAIIAIIGVVFLGPCWSASCRLVLQNTFWGSAENATAEEQARINEALDWLGYSGDWEAEAAWAWYDSRGAYNSFLGIIRVNHWEDREGMVAVHSGLDQKVVVHQEFVTGSQWDVRLLALILVAEWQHFEHPGESEQQCQQRLMSFRQRLGLEEVAPDFQHGFGEGKGVE